MTAVPDLAGGTPPGALTTVVIPTVGRPSLQVLLAALASGSRPLDARVVVVDDRADGAEPLEVASTSVEVEVLRSRGRGPAAARNIGWRAARTPWVSFLDDDVVPEPDWYARLLVDLDAAGPAVVGSQGRVHVPLPAARRPTDWERSTAGLAEAAWITADMSFRRAALVRVGGFDERFTRAYREDADLALRLQERGGSLVRGERRITHPVRPTDDWVSVRVQSGNADDQLMRTLHGAHWRRRAAAPPGRFRRHRAISGAAFAGTVGVLTGHRRTAVLGTTLAAAGIAELAWARIAPGPRDAAEVGRMLRTSAVIPFAATWHALRGWCRHRRAQPWRGAPDLVLFDRDGTLIHDMPYNGDPGEVRPLPGVPDALRRVRRAGVRTGLVTNQSGVARGLISRADVDAVNQRVAELLGPFDVVLSCPHGPDDGCGCRKPEPGMVRTACAELGVDPAAAVMIGDTGADVAAGARAGATPILVPNDVTRREEVATAPRVCRTVGEAADQLLSGLWR
jgi:histidinol-phosphate phosphatase family protein